MGDGLDEEAGVVGNSPLGLQSAFSTLGAEYGYVPDSWLAAAFQDIPTPKDAAEAGSDGDGYANWEEWVAGTDPKDAGSALRVTGLEVGADGAFLPRQGFAGVRGAPQRARPRARAWAR